jgi:hypothetical protein
LSTIEEGFTTEDTEGTEENTKARSLEAKRSLELAWDAAAPGRAFAYAGVSENVPRGTFHIHQNPTFTTEDTEDTEKRQGFRAQGSEGELQPVRQRSTTNYALFF